MKFCSNCGNTVSHIIPDGDNRPRYVCDKCHHIHYQNPRVIAGCLPVYEDKVLLCKRAIDPRTGFWTLPAGFLENHETVVEGALRETREEANANTEIDALYTVFSLPHISQVYMFFRARLTDQNFSAGAESLDVRLFSEADIPWDELAFPLITDTLKFFFEDRLTENYPTRYEEIIRPLKKTPE